jgi:hypothetical protein
VEEGVDELKLWVFEFSLQSVHERQEKEQQCRLSNLVSKDPRTSLTSRTSKIFLSGWLINPFGDSGLEKDMLDLSPLETGEMSGEDAEDGVAGNESC